MRSAEAQPRLFRHRDPNSLHPYPIMKMKWCRAGKEGSPDWTPSLDSGRVAQTLKLRIRDSTGACLFMFDYLLCTKRPAIQTQTGLYLRLGERLLERRRPLRDRDLDLTRKSQHMKHSVSELNQRVRETGSENSDDARTGSQYSRSLPPRATLPRPESDLRRRRLSLLREEEEEDRDDRRFLLRRSAEPDRDRDRRRLRLLDLDLFKHTAGHDPVMSSGARSQSALL